MNSSKKKSKNFFKVNSPYAIKYYNEFYFLCKNAFFKQRNSKKYFTLTQKLYCLNRRNFVIFVLRARKFARGNEENKNFDYLLFAFIYSFRSRGIFKQQKPFPQISRERLLFISNGLAAFENFLRNCKQFWRCVTDCVCEIIVVSSNLCFNFFRIDCHHRIEVCFCEVETVEVDIFV